MELYKLKVCEQLKAITAIKLEYDRPTEGIRKPHAKMMTFY